MMQRVRGFNVASIILATLAAACSPISSAVSAQEAAVAIPAPSVDPVDSRTSATAILAGGCFWGVEGVFSHVRGVTGVTSGYHGGSAENATYDRISSGTTGHAESVRITYDPRIVSYGTLLRVFFSVVTDPTTLNRQGPDVGSQYRSAIVAANAEQRRVATAYIAQLTRGAYWSRPIVTRVESPMTYYRAEPYHQDFMALHPNHGYIRSWDAPKLANFRAMYPSLYTATAAP